MTMCTEASVAMIVIVRFTESSRCLQSKVDGTSLTSSGSDWYSCSDDQKQISALACATVSKTTCILVHDQSGKLTPNRSVCRK